MPFANPQKEINVSDLESAVYFLRIYTGTLLKRFVRNGK